MGFHLLDLLPILVIGLLILGPKTFQSVARNAGKGVKKAKSAKDDLLADLPVEEINKIAQQIPMSPQQAVLKLLTPQEEEARHAKRKKKKVPSVSIEEESSIDNA
ncbi:MAG TPA: twin-arginine translocase TatA/TatE family subunit [Ktedonobacteraceae bacterium]|nr:twin-arginine translocase TatA/TatE family subunit [Ktedonobacteraceae bacterium]